MAEQEKKFNQLTDFSSFSLLNEENTFFCDSYNKYLVSNYVVVGPALDADAKMNKITKLLASKRQLIFVER